MLSQGQHCNLLTHYFCFIDPTETSWFMTFFSPWKSVYIAWFNIIFLQKGVTLPSDKVYTNYYMPCFLFLRSSPEKGTGYVDLRVLPWNLFALSEFDVITIFLCCHVWNTPKVMSLESLGQLKSEIDYNRPLTECSSSALPSLDLS